MAKVDLDDYSLKIFDFVVSSNTMSGLDGDNQPINDIVLQVKGN